MTLILPEYESEATEPVVCQLLASLVAVRRPKTITEAGTYRGHSALLMADACRYANFGHVWTYDPFDHGVQEYIDKNDLSEWCTWVQDDYMGSLRNDIEFAFIDASGFRDDGRRDASIREVHFFATLERLRPKGIVCVHDTHEDFDWSDGDGGKSLHRIRAECQINLDMGRGLSIHYAG